MKLKLFTWAPICVIGLVGLSLTGFSADSAKSERPNAAGTWKWTITTQDGQTFESSATLKQDGEKLTGSYQGRGGEAAIEEGAIKGSAVSFKVTRKRDDQTFVIKYEGKLDGDKIKGNVEVGNADRTFEWNAKREASKSNPTGTWAWSMARDNGQKMEATLKLKAEGDKLTGSVAGGDWTVEIENGRVKGDEISFQTSHDRDGQKIVAKSKGKISGNAIKGTVEFSVDGEARTRDWEAQRQ